MNQRVKTLLSLWTSEPVLTVVTRNETLADTRKLNPAIKVSFYIIMLTTPSVCVATSLDSAAYLFIVHKLFNHVPKLNIPKDMFTSGTTTVWS